MSTLEIIDAHMHVSDPGTTPRSISPLTKLFGRHEPLYAWMAKKVTPSPVKDFLGDMGAILHGHSAREYQAEAAAERVAVQAVVHVENDWQPRSGLGPAGETRWVEKVAFAPGDKSVPRLGAVVGAADLQNLKWLKRLLLAHEADSNKFVGVRDILAWNRDPGVWRACRREALSRQTTWRTGFEMLAEHRLSFDAWVYHSQLDELSDLARDYPSVEIILCHMGTPLGVFGPFAGHGHTVADRDQTLRQWQDSISRIAQYRNVTVKLSGMFMPVLGWGLHLKKEAATRSEIVERLAPLVDFVIGQFGAERCMFASNFPIDKPSISLVDLYQVYHEIVANRSPQERESLFSGTARRVYRIKE